MALQVHKRCSRYLRLKWALNARYCFAIRAVVRNVVYGVCELKQINQSKWKAFISDRLANFSLLFKRKMICRQKKILFCVQGEI